MTLFARYSATRHDKLKAEGRCWDCGGELTGQYRRCDPCRTKINRQRRQARPKRREARLCWDCGGKTILHYVRCTDCHAKQTNSRVLMLAGRKAEGRCRDCGKLAANYYSRCRVCMAAQERGKRKRRKEAIAEALPVQTTGEVADGPLC